MQTPFPQSITSKELQSVYEKNQAPFYIYDEKIILEKIQALQEAFSPIPFTLRYALKANPHSFFLKLFHKKKVHFDASSLFEVKRLIQVGVPAEKIMLTSQEFSDDLENYYASLKKKFFFNATSLSQLTRFGKSFPEEGLSIRINPGTGSGLAGRTKVAGSNSSFGIWHEDLDEIKKIVKKLNLKITKIHTHIGSGTDPKIWTAVAKMSIRFLTEFPLAKVINLGGGLPVARAYNKPEADIPLIAKEIMKTITDFSKEEKQEIQLELEPGTFLMANSGLLISKVNDIVATKKNQAKFLKLNIGMNDFLRPAMYGAEHAMEVLNQTKKKEKYFIIGHCCEESDTLATYPNEPSKKKAILLNQAKIGDLFLIHGVGAYGKTMGSHYNSFPFLAEYVKTLNGKIKKISKQQKLNELLQNELV